MRSKARFLLGRLAILISASLVIVSCSSETDVVPQASSPAGVPGDSSSQAPQGSRYPVESPLDVSPFLDDPCSLVSPGLLDSLGFSSGEGREKTVDNDDVAALAGPYCGWLGEDEGNLTVGIQSGNTQRGTGGLEGIRALHEQGRFKFWEEASISGYPSAYYGLNDYRAQGDCSIVVGVAEDMTFSVSADFYYDNPEKACGIAQEVAGGVIQNLQEEN